MGRKRVIAIQKKKRSISRGLLRRAGENYWLGLEYTLISPQEGEGTDGN